MNDNQNIKRLLLPGLKRSPIIIGIMVIALLLASRAIIYQVPMYESTAKIKLDDKTLGFSNTNLYKDFDVFTTKQSIMTEVEVLKSKELIISTLSKLDFDISYFRTGKIKMSELYHDSPFYVEYEIYNSGIYDTDFSLSIIDNTSFILKHGFDNDQMVYNGRFGEILINDQFRFKIYLNDSLIAIKKDLKLIDNYQFKIHSEHQLANIVKSNIDIKEVDKDIAVIRISYKSAVPEKATLLVNTLAETYITDYIATKVKAASNTLDFIDSRIEYVSNKLKLSEEKLEKFKIDNDVVNTLQETETGLREISQLRIQLNNLEIREATLDTLNKYINESNSDFLKLAPQVAFGDLLYTELIKKLKEYQSEREDLLIKYTPTNDMVVAIDKKIEDVIAYIKESIRSSKKEISIQREELESRFQKSSVVFEELPTREKEMLVAERDFMLNQSIYKFLMEKRTEASIAKAATLSFHRILEFGNLPDEPVSPNKKLIIIVSGFLGLIGGIFLVYAYEFMNARIRTRHDIEKISSTPVAGVVPSLKQAKPDVVEELFSTLASGINENFSDLSGKVITITSSISGEGKSTIASKLAVSYAKMGWKVLIVDFNLRAPAIHNYFNTDQNPGIGNIIEEDISPEKYIIPGNSNNPDIIPAGNSKVAASTLVGSRRIPEIINKLKEIYDVVLIDTPASAFAIDAIKMMKYSDLSLYLVRSGFTKSEYFLNSDMIKEEYGIENIRIVVNSVHKATNFNGHFTGSNLSYSTKYKGFGGRIKRYFKYYF